MTAFLKACLYGLVQGLTEFLPVSSSGHLVVAKHYLGVEDAGITMEVLTHAATALAATVYLRARIAEMVKAVWNALRIRRGDLDDSSRRDVGLVVMLIVASLPAAVVGFLVRDYVEGLFSDVSSTAMMLIVTGIFVYVAGRSSGGERRFNLPRALLVGAAQAAAIVPGLSRSGLTVGTGLMLGVDRKRAFEFALMLSIPVILGATLFEFAGGRLEGGAELLAGAFLAAFVSGYFAISMLFRSVVKNRLHLFAYYLIPMGIILLIVR